MNELVEKNKLGIRYEVSDIDVPENLNKVNATIMELKEFLVNNENVAGICGPQLGFDDRVFVLRFEGNDFKAFINPMISKREGLHLTRESCLNIPNKEYIYPRNDKIILIYQKENRLPEENIFDGDASNIIQQMVDILDGVLIDDIGLEVFEEFDQATEEEREELLDWYVNSLTNMETEINKEIDSDEWLHKQKQAIDYMTSVATGETKVEVLPPKLSSKDLKNLKKYYNALSRIGKK